MQLFIDLNPSDDFECQQGNFLCIEIKDINKILNVIICPIAPCSLMKYKFGAHKTIIKYYLRTGNYLLANLYFQNLIPLFNIDCDIEKLDKINTNMEVKINKENLPVGCKLFVADSELEKWENEILNWSNHDSDVGLKNYKTAINSFSKLLIDNLNRLQHLAIDSRTKLDKELRDKYYKLLSISAQTGDMKIQSAKLPIQSDVLEALTNPDNQEKTTGV